MSFPKLFLMPIAEGGDDRTRMRGVLQIAKYFSAHLRVMHTALEPKSLLPKGIKLPQSMLHDLDAAAMKHADRDAKEKKELFVGLCNEEGVEVLDTPEHHKSATASWFEARGVRSMLVAHYGRMVDWIVLSRPSGGEITASIEAAIFESGRPVFVVPRKLEQFSLDTVIVAWNNTQESSKAIYAGLPVLKKATKVLLITCGQDKLCKKSLKEMLAYLEFHGVNTTTKQIKSGASDTGKQLVQLIRDESATMLIMGASENHYKVRVLVFGDITRYIFKYADIPFLMFR